MRSVLVVATRTGDESPESSNASGRSDSAFQLCVLLFIQAQEYTATAGSDGLIQHQADYLISNSAAPLHQLYHPIGRFEVQPAGKRSLQILLKEFHNPYRGQVPIDAF